MVIQNSDSGYPTANAQRISLATHRPLGTTDVMPCNFKSPTTLPSFTSTKNIYTTPSATMLQR